MYRSPLLPSLLHLLCPGCWDVWWSQLWWTVSLSGFGGTCTLQNIWNGFPYTFQNCYRHLIREAFKKKLTFVTSRRGGVKGGFHRQPKKKKAFNVQYKAIFEVTIGGSWRKILVGQCQTFFKASLINSLLNFYSNIKMVLF